MTTTTLPCTILPLLSLGRISIAGALIFLNAASALAASGPHLPAGSTIAGPAAIVDGDTIDIAGQRVRLEGIDAPETSQTCETASGQSWPCGRESASVLRTLLQDKDVACDSRGNDRYGRLLGICFADGENINQKMVRSGYAWAFVKYSVEFVGEEATARAGKIGIWQGSSQAPWDYRHREWQTAESSAPKGCAIKGNISNKGHIYHLPWNPWYDRVKIDEGRGERWFCSEADALSAGWRPAPPN